MQEQLSVILYLHASLHPEIGYRQGMHELLAPVLLAVDYDSITEDDCDDGDDQRLCKLCSRTWVSADTWAIFSVIMEGTAAWYEWREPIPPVLPEDLQAQYHHTEGKGPDETRPYVAPIILTCQRLQSEMLRASDPLLWQAMQSAGIEPQIYGM